MDFPAPRPYDDPVSENACAVAWYADDFSASVASVRLRMLVPMHELRNLGLQVVQFDTSSPVNAYSVIVFLKSQTERGLRIAREAKARGVRVVYDLCDNLFGKPSSRRQSKRLKVLDEFLRLADELVFSTATLAQQILAQHPGLHARVSVIPDALEPHWAAMPGWAGRWHLWRLRQFLRSNAGALHCVWFGITKADKRLRGADQLDAALRELEVFARQQPVTLTVISNRRMKYRSASRHWGIPHHFVPWSLDTFRPALGVHRVAVIPVTNGEFTRGKSVNRPATAILAGLGVVAGAIDSYEELRPFVFLDDWQRGLAYYAQVPPQEDPRLAEARRYLHDCYSGRQVARLWQQVLQSSCATLMQPA